MRLLAIHPAWTDVAVFEDVNAGRAIETFLAGKGLAARTFDDKLFRYFLFLRPPRVTFRVQVRRNQLPEAESFLDADAPDLLQRAIRCPSCGSLRASYPQMTRKFVLPTVMLHLGILLRVIDHECYCENCHFVWNLPEKDIRAAAKPASQIPFSPAR